VSPNLLSSTARLAGSSLLRLQADDRLVALVRAGHDRAFDAIVDRYRPELVRYCARLLGESRAEDAVQQALLNALVAMRKTDSELLLRPWLYRIAHNASVSVLRGARSEAALPAEPMLHQVDVADDVERRERLRDALVAVAALPAPQRDALMLRVVGERSHEEIAAGLGISAGAARQHIHRARVTLRAAVSAVTPYGLLVRGVEIGGATAASHAELTAGAGAGAAATIAKIGAGVLAAGALAGGAAKLPVSPLHHGVPKPPLAAQEAAAAPSTPTAAAVRRAVVAPARSASGAATPPRAAAQRSGGDPSRRSGRHGTTADDDRAGSGRNGDGERDGAAGDDRGSPGPGGGDDHASSGSGKGDGAEDSGRETSDDSPEPGDDSRGSGTRRDSSGRGASGDDDAEKALEDSLDLTKRQSGGLRGSDDPPEPGDD
jgi:RNA polymerase sigma factor (sigma-70 family)